MIPDSPKPQPGPRPGPKQRVERRLAAILYADIAGYSALMGRSEEGTHRRVGAEFGRVTREVVRQHGRTFGIAGDGLMAEFPSAVEALRCALRIQAASARRNAKLPQGEWLLFRIGVNSGEIMLQDGRTGGTAVNVAARLQSLAEPGGLCLSAAVYDQVHHTVPASYEPVGEQRLKNIRDPVMVYAIRAASCSSWAPAAALVRPSLPDTSGDYRASLAVLPFRTLQKDQADAYFAEGIIDDIIRALGGLQDLLVISRSSTAGFARMPLDVGRVGRELDVRYVLHGSVRRSGDLLRIAVELCAAQSGGVIWADRFDGRLADLFDLQDRIAVRVATAIAPQLRDQELGRALRKHPDSMTAYDLTLQALDFSYRMDRSSLEQASALLTQACALDGSYAPAFSHQAQVCLWIIGQGWSEDEGADQKRILAAATRAVELDRNDALGLAFYGHQQSYLFKNYHVANASLERSIAAGPSCAWAWILSSLTCGYLGDSSTAVLRAEQAMRLSPIGPDAFWFEHFLSQAYYLDGRFEDAIAWARMSAAHAGLNTSNLRCLIVSLGSRDKVLRTT
jgi:adenylate cyclase